MIEKDLQARLAVQRLVASIPLPRGGKKAAAALGPRASATVERQTPSSQPRSTPSGQPPRALQLLDLAADRAGRNRAPTAAEHASRQAAPANPGETFPNSPLRPFNFVFEGSTPPTHPPSRTTPAPLPAPLPPTHPAAVAARAAHRRPLSGKPAGSSTAPALGSDFSAVDLRAALKSATKNRKQERQGAVTGPVAAFRSSHPSTKGQLPWLARQVL